MTPNLAYVQVSNPHWRSIGLWLPLFLLWIPVLLLAPLAIPIVLIACLLWRIRPVKAASVVWGILSSLSGTDVDINAGANLVHVRIL